jgi:DNA-binding XRE family transcriptional regulator
MRNNLRVERARLKISQTVLAEALNVTRFAIRNIENNESVPTVFFALRAAHYFNVNPSYLFYLGEEDFDNENKRFVRKETKTL